MTYRTLIAFLAGALVGLLSPGTAGATVVSAAANDPVGDSQVDGTQITNPPIDFARVAVEYDDQAGRVSGSFAFDQSPVSSQTVWAGIGLGVTAPNGSCNAPDFVPRRSGAIGGWDVAAPQFQATVQGHYHDGSDGVRAAVYAPSPPTLLSTRPPTAYDWASGPKQVFNFATVRPELAGRGYNCARFASASAQSSPSRGSVDQLNGQPVPLSPTSLPPPASTPPRTLITGGPVEGDQTRETTARFSFVTDRPATFRCRLYRASAARPPLGACSGTASHTVKNLQPGGYVFEVSATDTAGNTEPTPAKRAFTVLRPLKKAAEGGSRPWFPILSNEWSVVRGRTSVITLKARGLPKRTTAVMTCRGRGCPFRRKKFGASKGSTIKLQPAFGKRTLRTGSTVVITLDMPDIDRHRVQFKTRKGRTPKRTDFCPKKSKSKSKSKRKVLRPC